MASSGTSSRASCRVRTLLLVLVLVASSWSPAQGEEGDPIVPAEVRARAGTTVSVTVSRSVARAGTKAVVTGKVSGQARRPVVLETKVAGSWRTLTMGRTGKTRRYRLQVPTDWYHRHALRVRAPAAGGRPTGISRTRKVLVKPTYRPAGDRSDYNLPYGEGNYRWNPCEPIEWRFHQGGGFAGSLKVVKRALLEISGATGLAFTYDGTTSKVPIRDDTSGVADLVIGWTTPQQVGELSGGTAGYGGARASGPDEQHLEINQAAVALDQTESLAETYAEAGGVTWGQVMVHELGHGIGLDHAAASDQLMFSTATSANSRLGKGDLRGMELVGLTGGCWDQGAR